MEIIVHLFDVSHVVASTVRRMPSAAIVFSLEARINRKALPRRSRLSISFRYWNELFDRRDAEVAEKEREEKPPMNADERGSETFMGRDNCHGAIIKRF